VNEKDNEYSPKKLRAVAKRSFAAWPPAQRARPTEGGETATSASFDKFALFDRLLDNAKSCLIEVLYWQSLYRFALGFRFRFGLFFHGHRLARGRSGCKGLGFQTAPVPATAND
jgi:hypothetical protein